MRKSSKSLRKSSPSKHKRKNECYPKCSKKVFSSLNIQNSLSRKYSTTQSFHHITALNQILKNDSFVKEIQKTQAEEYLKKYCKSMNQKQIFPRIKEVYKLHRQIPRIFQPQVKEILNKCYHRKRLLEYFKITKVLGIKVENVKFGSFLISLNEITNKTMLERKNFDPIITKISTIDFSTEAEKDFLEEFLNYQNQSEHLYKENCIFASNSQYFS